MPVNMDEFKRVVASGEITKASRTELEHYAVALSTGNAFTHFNGGTYEQVCGVVRTLILVRMSEQANAQATRISTIALVVSLAALIVAIAQFIWR